MYSLTFHVRIMLP